MPVRSKADDPSGRTANGSGKVANQGRMREHAGAAINAAERGRIMVA